MGKTKKAGSAGRFGARYGSNIRQKVSEIERKQKARYECPKCHRFALKRLSAGIWHCKACEVKMAGKAYIPWE